MSKEEYINYNGKLVLRSELNLGLNRAMRFGDGVFETIRVIDGELVWWNEHFERLLKGLKYLYIDVPELFIDELLVDCLATLHRNQIIEGGILRVFIYRKGNAGYTPTTYDFDYVVETEAFSQNKFELNKKGLTIGISETVRINSKLDSNIKTLNKIPYIRAAAERVKNGWDEILILNETGFLAEASSSNLFVLIDGVWRTPLDSQGALNGITRNQIVQILEKKNQIVRKQKISIEDLSLAKSIFICNSVSGVKWVGSFRKSRYFNTQIKSILDALNTLLEVD